MILVYKVYLDGFVHIDLGSSAAQSVLLMIFALVAHPAAVPLRRAERELRRLTWSSAPAASTSPATPS